MENERDKDSSGLSARPRTDIRQPSRREFLKALLALGLSACSLDQQFFQNFNVNDFKPFNPEDYPERTDIPVEDSAIGKFFDGLIKDSLGYEFPIQEYFDFKFQDGKLINSIKMTTEALKQTLEKNGYTIEEFSSGADSLILFVGKTNQPDTLRIVCTDTEIVIGLATNNKAVKSFRFHLADFLNEGEDRPNHMIADVHKNMVTGAIPEERKVVSGDGSTAFITEDKAEFDFPEDEKFSVHNTESLIHFLKSCKSQKIIEVFLNSFFSNSINIQDIQTIDQLIEIFRLLPKDPRYLSTLMQHAFKYAANDSWTGNDEFRNPIETLQSGWGDCDDYAIINYFWAHLHGFGPFLVRIKNTKAKNPKEGDTRDGTTSHVIVWYKEDETDRIVVLDNQVLTFLEAGKNITDYFEVADYEGEIDYNKHI